MRMFVKSLKRLFEAKRITQEKLNQLETEGKITTEEKTYIEDNTN